MNSAAGAATYIPVVPPPGAASVTVFDINDSNIIAGSFNDSAGVEHGFFGPLDGSNYTVLDIPEGTTGTEPRGIGNDGSITGLAKGSGFVIAQEFFRHPDGSYTILHNPYRTFDGVAQGIDDQDGFVGDFYGDLGVRVGYKGIDGQYKHRIKLPIVRTSTNPRDHSNNGLLGGGYNDKNNVQHAFAINNR
ncbi:MAG: hypothetical protein JOY77_12545, partial [Alphaproteobacteria bacterium]|nr:hypothetical protein [Alphaproteobacteria bacterium]